jgi:DNA-binding NarL/FixJ family response regulator
VFTLLLVDDHELVRSGLRLLLESSLGHKVMEASSGPEALDILRSKRFDVALLDVRMPGRDGLWTLEQIRTLIPDLPVLMLSTYDDEDSIRGSLERGAAGYLLKEAGVAQVAEAIETAFDRRGVYLHPIAAERLVWGHRPESREQMTDRERDVLELLVEGATNDEIAHRLFVTEKTVKTHLSAIFRKLGVSNRTHAATKALRESLSKE